MSLKRVIILFLLILSVKSFSESRLVLVTGNPHDLSFQGRWLHLIYSEAFERLGLLWEYKVYPAKRRDLLLDSGDVDGELSRVFTYGDHHPGLIRVDESPFSIKFSFFAADPQISLDNVKNLIDRNYTVGYIRGAQKPEDIRNKLVRDGIVNSQDFRVHNTYEIGLRNLFYSRTDLFLSNAFPVFDTMALDEFAGNSVKEVLVVSEVPIYAYLLRKHEQVAIELSDVIRDLKAEGAIEDFRNQAANALVRK